MFAGAAASAVALVLVIGDGADVGAGGRRPAPTTPPGVTVDNPVTGASVPDAVFHGTSAPRAVEVRNGASGARPARVIWLSPLGVVLSA
jgi:hypothetical protein